MYSTASDCHPDEIFKTTFMSLFGFVLELGIQFNVALGIVLQVNLLYSLYVVYYVNVYIVCFIYFLGFCIIFKKENISNML